MMLAREPKYFCKYLSTLVPRLAIRHRGLWIILLLAFTNNLASTELIEFRKGEHQLFAEVALTASQRSRGLMWRMEMADNMGMLFILEPQSRQCFWMRNTYLPLTIAFLNQDFKIMQLNDMTPLSEELHCSEEPAHFALEVNQGWFAQRDIQVGDHLEATLR